MVLNSLDLQYYIRHTVCTHYIDSDDDTYNIQALGDDQAERYLECLIHQANGMLHYACCDCKLNFFRSVCSLSLA